MPILMQLQKLPWKGDGGWKKVPLRRFLFCFLFCCPEDREFVEKMRFGAIAYFQTHYDYGPQKMPLKLSV